MKTYKVAIVTGGSGGIGRCTALALAKAGCRVYEFSRHEKGKAGDVLHVTADMTDEASVQAAVTEVERREGRIDILVCNAGFGISGAPIMRAQGGGRIVCMSSIAGILPIPFQLWYSVSKAAINAYVLALQNEVRPFGISVCAVMPGDIASGFTANRKKTLREDAYGGRVARSVARMEHDEETGMSPEAAGAFIAKTALKKSSRPLIALGLPYKAAASAAKLLPRSFSNLWPADSSKAEDRVMRHPCPRFLRLLSAVSRA